MEKDIQQLRTESILIPEVKVEFTPQELKQIESYKNSIDLTNTTQIIQYGTSGQLRASAFATEQLKQVQTKDIGETSNLLINLKEEIFSVETAANQKSIFPFFDNIKKKIRRLQAHYSKVETNINAIELQLERHYKIMMKDVTMFDKLFEESKNHFKELSLFIAAGDEKLMELNTVELPRLKAIAEQDNDPAKIHEYKDKVQQVVRFDRKVHDLKLTRMILLQSAPQIRDVQNNSLSLMEKLQSSIVNTIPLWKNQMVMSLGIARSQQALKAQQAITNATNELLKRNSEMLKDSTIKIAQETERGIVDIETIRKVNADIISTIDEIVRIQEEGKEKRRTVEVELLEQENELKKHLLGNTEEVR